LEIENERFRCCAFGKEVSILEINVKEVRLNLAAILDRVEKGEEIVIELVSISIVHNRLPAPKRKTTNPFLRLMAL
jgi:hypothetical protein